MDYTEPIDIVTNSRSETWSVEYNPPNQIR